MHVPLLRKLRFVEGVIGWLSFEFEAVEPLAFPFGIVEGVLTGGTGKLFTIAKMAFLRPWSVAPVSTDLKNDTWKGKQLLTDW